VEVIHNAIGIVASPNYPEDYDNNLQKIYHISAPRGSEILLIVNDFDVQESFSCNGDFLQASAFQ